jgi:sec-independent protein translocase protein TatB
MSFSETVFLFFLALVVFGPKKLPEIARLVGKYLNEFKRASNEFKAQIEQEIAHMEVENKQTILPPSPPPEGTASRSLSASEAPASESQPATVEAAVDGISASTNPPTTDSPIAVATPGTLPADSVPSAASQESHV